MVGVSTAAHVAIFAGLAIVGTWLATHRPEPIIAYSVELTDFPGTGGRLPAGPGNNLIGRSPPAPAAKPSAPPPAPPAAAAPKPAEPVAAAPPPAAEAAPVAPKPVPKPVAKVAVKKIEPKKVEPTKAVEAPKTPPKPAAPVAKSAVEPPPAAATPAPEAKPAASAAASPAAKPAKPSDDYASAAQRFRDRMAAVGSGAGAPGEGVAGGGPGGGMLGAGGDGRGGGQVKSLEWLAYRQRILNSVKERWSNAIKRPGLLTTVRFRIARDGKISNVQVSRASGNVVYDQTAVAAVERVSQLPPPPPAYADEFAEFEVNFHGEETGGVS
jgi:protein TonB